MQNQDRTNPVFVLHSAFIALRSAKRVTDGTRTRDVQDHNLALYQLSYGYQPGPKSYPRRPTSQIPQPLRSAAAAPIMPGG